MLNRQSVLVDGVDVSYFVGGPEKGQPVLFLHGIPASASLWKLVASNFIKQGYRVYAPDLPGYGATKVADEYDDNVYSLSGTADILEQWLDCLSIDSVWLVAHDIGGGVGQIFACRYPERVSYLTLSNCIVSNKWPVPIISLVQRVAKLGLYTLMARIGGMTHGLAWHKLKKSVFNKQIMSRSLARKIFWQDKVYSRDGRKAFAKHVKALSPEELCSYDQAMHELKIPTLLAWAKNDPNQPWEVSGKWLQDAIPHAEVRLLDNAGHFFQLEKADEYAAQLVCWHHQQTSSTFG